MSDLDPHDDLPDLAYPYALDALTDAQRDQVERLLARADEETAAEFRATVREVRETLATMTAVDAVPAPAEVEAALQRALDARSATASVTPLRRARPRILLAAAAVLVAAIAAAIGITVYQNQTGDPSETTAQQVLDHADTRTDTVPVTGGGSVTVGISRQLDAAAVSFDAVPAAPTGRTYQMWLIPPGGQPHSAGVLETLPAGRAPLVVRLDLASTLALSVEPAGGSPAPTTDPIVAVPLD
ncbi:anti-sigma-K factor RskA [Nocardia transvalensis]|uniref:Regulator of SigK n=1 Tax=Nocardia transvalensis TaxID=37333 RepID=A0A7W9PMC4_9NOCA|nr:anti-sigma factor [Nocardia transvalensis]MBB5918299.1 anti-sigma-K factor RskA [Nocardia transvalensis]